MCVYRLTWPPNLKGICDFFLAFLKRIPGTTMYVYAASQAKTTIKIDFKWIFYDARLSTLYKTFSSVYCMVYLLVLRPLYEFFQQQVLQPQTHFTNMISRNANSHTSSEETRYKHTTISHLCKKEFVEERQTMSQLYQVFLHGTIACKFICY